MGRGIVAPCTCSVLASMRKEGPSSGSSTETQKCGNPGCTTACGCPSACCGGPYQAVAYHGTIYCSLEEPISCVGSWEPWFNYTLCNDTCGMCGTYTQQRYCMPPGCQCTGSFTQTMPCAASVCASPRSACCTGFTEKANTCSVS
ncbi:unnamed protein product, partial [Mesorhabditis belari]|uniref:Uncharacterized protein n=1 Tax=Mesorhabditis belari TaxID=2138241 RepID=A0AAF3FAJ8_9BILA